MKYMLLLYGNEAAWEGADKAKMDAAYAAHGEFTKLVGERGAMLGGEELGSPRNATTVRTIDGDHLVTDGPYAETAEQLGGFYLIEAKDLDTALELARACPEDVVEVRPVVEYAGD